MRTREYVKIEHDGYKVEYDPPEDRMGKVEDFIAVKVDQGADDKYSEDVGQKDDRDPDAVHDELLNSVIQREKPEHAAEGHDFNDPRAFIIDCERYAGRVLRNEQDGVLII